MRKSFFADLAVVAVTCLLVAGRTEAAFVPTSAHTVDAPSAQLQSATFTYHAQAGTYPATLDRSGSFLLAQPGVDLTLPSPDGTSLFAVSFSSDSFTITALRTFVGGSFLDLSWGFTLDASTGASFSEASLVSSSLFSDPPFTFQIDPDVSYDAATKTITVSRFLAGGVGTATINNGGVAVVAFGVPEPTGWATLSFAVAGALAAVARRRIARPRGLFPAI